MCCQWKSKKTARNQSAARIVEIHPVPLGSPTSGWVAALLMSPLNGAGVCTEHPLPAASLPRAWEKLPAFIARFTHSTFSNPTSFSAQASLYNPNQRQWKYFTRREWKNRNFPLIMIQDDDRWEDGVCVRCVCEWVWSDQSLINANGDITCCSLKELGEEGHGLAEQEMQQFLAETARQSSNSCSEVLVWLRCDCWKAL